MGTSCSSCVPLAERRQHNHCASCQTAAYLQGINCKLKCPRLPKCTDTVCDDDGDVITKRWCGGEGCKLGASLTLISAATGTMACLTDDCPEADLLLVGPQRGRGGEGRGGPAATLWQGSTSCSPRWLLSDEYGMANSM